MSFDVIHKLQHFLYSKLSKLIDKDIVKQIYISVVKDREYPFILVDISEVKNLSNNFEDAYQIDFVISVFANNISRIDSSKISMKIQELLDINDEEFEDYLIAGIRPLKVNIENAHNIVSYKLSLHYKIFIKRSLFMK